MGHDIKMPTRFKLGQFLNSVEKSSQDKAGLNISIITVHLLFILIKIKTDTKGRLSWERKYLSEVEKLPAYTARNLRGKYSYILRVLIEVEKSNFRNYLFEQRIKKIKKQPPPVDFYESLILPEKEVLKIITQHLF